MPKGEQPKLNGSIRNIPISELDANCMALVRPADSNGLIVVKLKCAVEYRSHVLFEPIQPSFIESALKFMNQFNHLSKDIKVNVNNILEELTGLAKEKDYIKEIMTKNI